MIHDSLAHSSLYETVHPRFKAAFDFLKSTDLMSLPEGKIELDGTNLYVSVSVAKGKSVDEAKMETHNKYIDIQIPLSTVETMGWIATENLVSSMQAYDENKDITFFADKATSFVSVSPGEFAIFFPQDGHQPCISEEETIRKIVVKVLV